MKLYLSSYRIPTPKSLAALVGKDQDTHVAVIPNAKDYYAERARAVKIQESTDYLYRAGLASTVVDLRDYTSAVSLERRLKSFDLVWVMGGNTFCLMHEIGRSGFDKAIKALEHSIVYGGESAGAVAAGLSLRGIESADEPAFAESVIHNGMGLLPYVVLPHADNPNFQDANSTAKHLHPTEQLLMLNDNQAAVIIDGKVTITKNNEL